MKKLLVALPAVLLSGCFPAAGSVGVIGGADGPTAIFVSSPIAAWLPAVLVVAAIVIIGLVVWIKRK